jgi:ribonuclease PH
MKHCLTRHDNRRPDELRPITITRRSTCTAPAGVL